MRAAAALVIALIAAGSEPSAPSRTVDRTVACTPVATFGGMRDLDVAAQPRGPQPFGQDPRVVPAYLDVSTGPDGPDTHLVTVNAAFERRWGGWPAAPGVYAHGRRCTSTDATVPISARGLPAPPLRYAKEIECSVRGRVLVRVRAVLTSAASWSRRERGYIGARSNVVEATVAVRAQRTGKPLALIELDRSGKTRFWIAPGCG